MMFCKDNQADQRHCFKVLKCDKFFSQLFFGEKKIKPTSWSQAELYPNWENRLFIYSITRLSRKNSPETSCRMTQTLGMT